MASFRTRAVLAALLAAGALLLSGCRVEGTVDVAGVDDITMDVVVRGGYQGCDQTEVGIAGLQIEATGTYTDGVTDCHLWGKPTAEALSQAYPMVLVSQVGDYYLVATNLIGSGANFDVLLRLPGAVAEANGGEVSGNTVRITAQNAAEVPLRILAERPGLAWSRWALGLGALAAAGLAGWIGWRLGRRRGQTTPVSREVFHVEADGSTHAVPLREAPAWDESQAGSGAAATKPKPETDHTVWAPPGPAGPTDPHRD